MKLKPFIAPIKGALLSVLLFIQVSFGQEGRFQIDSLFPSNFSDTLNVVEFNKDEWILGKSGVFGLNQLVGVQDYHPLLLESVIRSDLGNIGSAEHTLLFDGDRKFGFNFRNSRRNYWFSNRHRRLMISNRMFSNVQYSNGVNRENFLDINFTRGFGELLDLGFNFRRIVTQGFYQRQTNTITDFVVNGAFKSADNRYRAVLGISYFNLRNEENGGITSDSVFEQNTNSNREFIDVNLLQSSNHWKGFEVDLNHRYELMKNDSTSSKPYRPVVSHSFVSGRRSMVYRNAIDSESNFYESIYQDSSNTYDSTNLLSVSNVLQFELLRSDSAKVKVLNRLAVGAGHSYYRVSYDSSFVEHINNVSVVANADGEIFRNFNWRANGNFMVFGYNIWDLKVDGGVRYEVGQSRFDAFVDYNLYRPDYLTDNYSSNHFAWDNSWLQTQHLQTGLVYEQKRLRFSGKFSYHLIDNLVVFGEDRLPYQSTNVNQLLSLRVQEHFRLKWFHIVLDGAVQWNMTGNEIRVPLAVGKGSVYYQNDLFKRKLRLQVGVQASYLTSYYANAYNPALSAFYLQGAKQVGNNPFIDVFLNIRVKKLRAFVKFTHINAGWLGYNYYHVPGYPVNDFAWHFGINWAFLD